MKNSLLALILFLPLSLQLTGQTPIPPVTDTWIMKGPGTYTIMDISVTGVKFLQTSYLVNISGLDCGTGN